MYNMAKSEWKMCFLCMSLVHASFFAIEEKKNGILECESAKKVLTSQLKFPV